MMSTKRLFLPLYILIFLTLFPLSAVFSQDNTNGAADIDENTKPSIILVPLSGKDVPSYIPMIIDRLFEAKIDKTKAYSIFTRNEFTAILQENNITLPGNITDKTALEIGKKLGMDQVLFGVVGSENSGFVIKTKIMDVKSGKVISKDNESAVDIKGLEVAVGKLTRSIVKTVLPPETVASAVESLDAADQTAKEATAAESISAFDQLVEEDPDKALNLVSEPTREAIKDKAREEVVDEEVQNLFDQEKANRKRKWQFWTMIGLESSVQLGNYFGAAAIDLRLESEQYWSNYMNNIFIDDPYRDYRDLLKNSQDNQILNYIFTGGANTGLAFAYKAMPDNLFSFTAAGRQIFAISSLMQISGYMAQAATSQLGFYAQRKYFEYSTATNDFTSKYEAYRTAYLWPMIAEYSRTGLWTLGLAGMVTAALLPGDKTPMILSAKSRKYLTWGQSLISLGNITSGMANNFRGKAEEYWITDNSPSGTIGDSSYTGNFITSEILYYSTYAIYFGGAVLTYIGLTHGGGAGNDNIAAVSGSPDISFAVVPAQNGITAVARLRLD